jgi:HlyD family secretion protein
MNATVTIIVDQAQDVIVVPDSAVQSEGPASVVEVQNEDGTTEKVVVETGLSDGSNTEIISGLEEGQTVIVPSRSASSTTSSAQTQQGGFSIQDGPPGGGIVIEGGGP